MRGELAPHLKDFIKQVNIAIAAAAESGDEPTPELARERLAGLANFVSHVPEIAFVEQRSLKAEDREIPVLVYSPAPEEALPVVIYFHGGGHMAGSAELYDPMCRKIALQGRCLVLSVDYRLAPEFPYPCGIEDASVVVKRYQELLSGVNYNEHLSIAGDSAGGAICTSLSHRRIKDPSLAFEQQILIYPSVDYTMSCASMNENGEGYFLEKARIQWYFDHYFLNNEDPRTASPLFLEVNADFPETLVIIAGCDPLRDEGLAYADKLKQAGVPVKVHQFKQMIHAFMNIEDLVPEECRKLYQIIGDFIGQSSRHQ